MDEDNLSTDSGPKCRICLSTSDDVHIINPCNCAGTMGFVHSYCLEKWISTSCNTRCELCSCKYTGRKVLRYGIISSVPRYIWTRKSDCGLFYCYAKIWLYLYILLTLLREYRMDMDHLLSSLIFLTFLILSFITGIFILAYSVIKFMKSWNRWRRCQFKFITDNSQEDNCTQQV